MLISRRLIYEIVTNCFTSPSNSPIGNLSENVSELLPLLSQTSKESVSFPGVLNIMEGVTPAIFKSLMIVDSPFFDVG